MNKKVILISCLFVLIIGIYIFINNIQVKDNKTQSSDQVELLKEEEIEVEGQSNGVNENEVQVDTDIDSSDSTTIKKEVKNNDESIKSNNGNNTTTSRTTTNNSGTSNQTNQTSNNNSNSNVVEEKQDTTTTIKEENKYIGVPDPNSLYYSIHHGKIEYSTMDECVNASYDILFKDTVDILNGTCIDVVDSEGTILGEYLYIKCSSGNCDKYK